VKANGMSFEQFQLINIERCENAFPQCKEWTLNDWATALTGEVGEMCNLLKKVKRGDFPLEEVKDKIASEISDIITYADLLMSIIGADTEEELVKKFNEVSERVGYTQFVTTGGTR
jgi:NTP pyrophosphatase (non-canonical NTP hydrolase)